ncbi:hypothetical protein HF521_008931 [Silurus meridionalis]|uniref:Deoxycytidylate deaminase n=2 Tax=Silurus meridionalis TaxID=175797 RepID=A0A8T0BSL0_SILME|nr:hypothetical protein HF521_008931 [Silurus meridionalis]
MIEQFKPPSIAPRLTSFPFCLLNTEHIYHSPLHHISSLSPFTHHSTNISSTNPNLHSPTLLIFCRLCSCLLPLLLLLRPTVAQFPQVPCWLMIPLAVIGNPGLDRSVLPENNHKPHSLLHLQRNQKSDVMASKNRESGKDTEPGPPPPMATTGSYKDEVYFMTVALLFAKKSPDPNTKVGACIVNQEGKIVGIGYNKMPNGCENADFPWKRGKYDDPTTKHQYVCHAELNAIVNKTSVDVKGCTIYVTLFPCNQCARILIQSGVRNLVYLSNKRKDRPDTNVSNKLLDTAGVTCRQFTAQGDVCALLKSIDPNAE